MIIQQRLSFGHPCTRLHTPPCMNAIPYGAARFHRCRRLVKAQTVIPKAGSVWDADSMSLADLRSQLSSALEVEDYKTAADLRDSIQ